MKWSNIVLKVHVDTNSSCPTSANICLNVKSIVTYVKYSYSISSCSSTSCIIVRGLQNFYILFTNTRNRIFIYLYIFPRLNISKNFSSCFEHIYSTTVSEHSIKRCLRHSQKKFLPTRKERGK